MKKVLLFFIVIVLLNIPIYAAINCQQTQNIQSFVKRFYFKVLERTADNIGLDSWTNQLINHEKTAADVAKGFIFSQEFINKNKDDNEYIMILYKAFFNREPDELGFTNWIAQLSSDINREEVLHGFLHSQEFINLSNTYGIQAYEGAAFRTESLDNFVKRFYSEILGRDVDDLGIIDWTARLSTGVSTGLDIAFGFIFSTEFSNKNTDNATFLNILYRAFFDRTADIVGFDSWMHELNNGMTREELLNNFLHSQEFIDLANSYNILAFIGAPITIDIYNISPIANAGSDQTSFFSHSVILDGLESSDSDGNIVCYWWQEHETNTILGDTAIFIKSDFIVGTHNVNLTVVDDKGKSTSDSMILLVGENNDRDNDGIEDALDTPIADAQDITLNANGSDYSITLTGSDNDNTITFTVLTQPAHGTLSGTAPNLLYTPDDGYEGEDSFTFSVNDGMHESSTVTINIMVQKSYGVGGTHAVSKYVEVDAGNSIVYYPADIGSMLKTPLIFFCPGFQSQDHNSYKSLLTFIASHGYSVIYAKDYYGDPQTFIERFEKMLDVNNDVLPYVDITQIGVIGHSSGGGDTFKILDYFSKKGYGENARFLMALDPWFAFGMNSDAMRSFPSNTNLVIQRYEHADHPNTQDPRITLSEYALLDSLDNSKKDYQVFNHATHGYPAGSNAYTQMQGLLKPLDALMAYTFEDDADAHDVALENGSDTPYEDGLEIMNQIRDYDYRCNSHKNRSEVLEIDYCNQYLGGKIYPPDTVFNDKPEANEPKPNYLSSYVDAVFNNKVTRITDRENQSGNAHSYPKTQTWNADSTLIRLGYRIYNADNFSETTFTKNTLIRGSLTEMKWSAYEPDVFYGMDVRWDRFVFMKAKINREDNTITYIDMPNAIFMKSEYDEMKLGKYEGNLDYQDNYIVFSGRKKDTNRVTLMVYHLKDNYGTTYNRIESNVTTAMKWYVEEANGDFITDTTQANQMFDWASISALGNYVIVNYRSKKGDAEQEYSIEQYYKNLNHVRRLAEHGNHGDLGIDEHGKEVYVQFGFGSLNGESNLGIWMYPLDGIPRVQLLPDKYNGNHLSCRNYQRPGWCYLNTRYLWNGNGVREVFALKLDGSGTVQRFAQTHNSAENAGLVQVNVSPDGTKVLFSSDWGNENNIMDTYHVEVP